MITNDVFRELKSYVESHFLICEDMISVQEIITPSVSMKQASTVLPHDIDEFFKTKRKPSFRQLLFTYIDESGANDSDIYKKAFVDRRVFSRIRSNPAYHPAKHTAVALALALRLDLKRAENLLRSAGYTLSESETSDLILIFCFEHKIFDITDVDLALDYFGLGPLGEGSRPH